MSILSDFEDRVGGALEGAFASVFRSPVQPSEIAKTLGKAMDDGRVVGVGKVYAPVSYVIAISPEDADILGAFTDTLAGELATYLVDHARERIYHLPSHPHVAFIEDGDLRLGRFRVSAELAFAEDGAPRSHVREVPPATPYDRETEERDEPLPGLATVTVGETGHDVALRGERVVIGRVSACDICISDANVSRQHAALVLEGAEWAVEDLGSTNGTLLNGRPVESAVLADGDVIEVGATRLTFHANGR